MVTLIQPIGTPQLATLSPVATIAAATSGDRDLGIGSPAKRPELKLETLGRLAKKRFS